ncbi:hypothetical protein [Luteibacter sp. RCC_6_2]|uniref:hypothetical protein n=1 Tax=Luteibacter sp. RCC_6_2 TaxID=3239223 RepID=UPI00352578B9
MSHTLGRVFVAATFGLVVAYASLLADHARGEERNQRYALVLSSLDPYLVDLPEEQRATVKIGLAKTLFHQPSPARTAQRPRKWPSMAMRKTSSSC